MHSRVAKAWVARPPHSGLQAAVAAALIIGSACSRTPIHVDSAARVFDALSIAPPHRTIESAVLRGDGGRKYVVAAYHDLTAPGAVNLDGYVFVDRGSDGRPFLKGPDPTAGREGACSVAIAPSEGASSALNDEERAFELTIQCSTRGRPE